MVKIKKKKVVLKMLCTFKDLLKFNVFVKIKFFYTKFKLKILIKNLNRKFKFEI